jgi:hypothetical protein
MLVLMANDHKLIDTPILIIGSKAYKFNSSYELIKEDLAQGIRNHHANTEEKRA